MFPEPAGHFSDRSHQHCSELGSEKSRHGEQWDLQARPGSHELRSFSPHKRASRKQEVKHREPLCSVPRGSGPVPLPPSEQRWLLSFGDLGLSIYFGDFIMAEPSWVLREVGQFWVTWGSFKSTYWSLGNHGWVGETCTSPAARSESISCCSWVR